MPMYEFEHKPSGERREFFFDMADAPEFGGKVRREGKTWTRIFGQGHQLGPVWSRRFVAHSQEPWDPDAPHYDQNGIPAFTTQQEADEYAAKKGLEYRDGRLGAIKGKKLPTKKKASVSRKTGS